MELVSNKTTHQAEEMKKKNVKSFMPDVPVPQCGRFSEFGLHANLNYAYKATRDSHMLFCHM